MKWMLVVMVFGAAPVKTELLYSTLNDCLSAEEAMRSEVAKTYNAWLKWAEENPKVAGFPASKEFQMRRLGLHNPATCIPHQ